MKLEATIRPPVMPHMEDIAAWFEWRDILTGWDPAPWPPDDPMPYLPAMDPGFTWSMDVVDAYEAWTAWWTRNGDRYRAWEREAWRGDRTDEPSDSDAP